MKNIFRLLAIPALLVVGALALTGCESNVGGTASTGTTHVIYPSIGDSSSGMTGSSNSN